jgi:hypothetical protein
MNDELGICKDGGEGGKREGRECKLGCLGEFPAITTIRTRHERLQLKE